MTDDKLRAALERIASLTPKGPFKYPTDELAEAQEIAAVALAASATDEGKSWTANVPKPPKAVIHQSVARPAVPEALDVPTYPPPLECCGGMYAHRPTCALRSKEPTA